MQLLNVAVLHVLRLKKRQNARRKQCFRLQAPHNNKTRVLLVFVVIKNTLCAIILGGVKESVKHLENPFQQSNLWFSTISSCSTGVLISHFYLLLYMKNIWKSIGGFLLILIIISALFSAFNIQEALQKP